MVGPAGKLFGGAPPSGAGKTSLVRELVRRTDNIGVAVSHTTREKRPEEKDGINYHFVSDDDFRQIAHQDGFIETAVVFGNSYGTSREAVDSIISSGKHLILEIDWQGARQIRQRMPEAISIFILPPSLQTLKDRLQNRAQDDDETISRRMAEAISELSHYDEFDFLIVNDDFETAVDEIQAIIDNMPRKFTRNGQKEKLARLLSELLSKKEL